MYKFKIHSLVETELLIEKQRAIKDQEEMIAMYESLLSIKEVN